MISVYSSYAIRAVQLTDYVQERFPDMKVIWGGPHCISVPEIGLRSADGICFSEGDEAVIDLVDRLGRGADWTTTPNFAFRVDGSLVTNPVRPPFNDLDSLPYYDFDLADQYLLDGTLEALTADALKARLAGYPYRVPIFYYMSSRGCPHDCAYCNNCRYTALWGRSVLRMQGVERVMRSLPGSCRGFLISSSWPSAMMISLSALFQSLRHSPPCTRKKSACPSALR